MALIFYDSCLNLLKTKGQPFIVYMHHAWTHQENNNNNNNILFTSNLVPLIKVEIKLISVEFLIYIF